MKTLWVKRLLAILLWGILGGILGAAFDFGINYGFAHWWRGNDYIGLGLLFLLPVIVARNLLGIPDTGQGISIEFDYLVYTCMGSFVFILLGLMWTFIRKD
jgi:hypothetical protein